MGIWEALEYLNTLVADSDPDTDLSQIEHNLQTAAAIRCDGHPRWMILTGLIHDLGKVLCLYGEPQWAVVGAHAFALSGMPLVRTQRSDSRYDSGERVPRVRRSP